MAERTNPDDPENAELALESDGGVVSARQKFQKLGDELQGRYKKVSDDVQDRYKKVSEDVQDRYKKVSEDVKKGAERASTEIRRGAERARETYGEVAENAEGATSVCAPRRATSRGRSACTCGTTRPRR